jgi:hypothetical protein
MITPAVAVCAALLLVALIHAPALLRSMLRGGALTLASGGREPDKQEADGPS